MLDLSDLLRALTRRIVAGIDLKTGALGAPDRFPRQRPPARMTQPSPGYQSHEIGSLIIVIAALDIGQ